MKSFQKNVLFKSKIFVCLKKEQHFLWVVTGLKFECYIEKNLLNVKKYEKTHIKNNLMKNMAMNITNVYWNRWMNIRNPEMVQKIQKNEYIIQR